MRKEVHPRLFRSEAMERCCLTDCRAACCLYGVWIDQYQADELAANAAWISPHMPAGFEDPQTWFDGREEDDEFTPSGRVVHSTVLPNPDHYGGSACVFLRDDHKCALQVAAVERGEHPWKYKPFYCVLHPLDLDEQGRVALDSTEEMLAEEGSCLRPSPVEIPLLKTFEPELRYLLGDEAYQTLVEQSQEQNQV